jgi:YidC/Oxa1 family membrane protein insertase
MDNKRQMVIVIVISVAIATSWLLLSSWMHRRHPEWYQRPEPEPTTQDGGAAAQPATTTATQPAGTMPSMTAAGGVRAVGGEAAGAELGYGQYDPTGAHPYVMGLKIDPKGAAVAAVTLNRFRVSPEKKDPFVYQQPYPNAPAESGHSLITRSIVVNDTAVDLANVTWRRTAAGEDTATYAVDVLDAQGQPLLMVSKQYQLQPAGSPSLGYEVVVTYGFQNRTEQPLKVKGSFNGPLVPPVENTRDIPEVVAGFNDEQQVRLEHNTASTFPPDKPPKSIKNKDGLPMLWAGFTSAYFNAIVLPPIEGGKAASLADVTAQGVAKQADNGQEFTALIFEMTEQTVAAGQSASLAYQVYFGPRQRAVLNTPHYSAFPRSYNGTLVMSGGMCGFCTVQKLVDVLVWMLAGFHLILRDWGLAIIALVLVVRLLLHPITKRSQISMAKMSKMGPEMERLKKKYGDNKEELNRAMVTFYKEQGAAPMVLGCLPMLLQMPIWIALWSSLQSTFELRHAPFLWGGTWIDDLSQPDRLLYFPNYAIKIFFLHIDAINLLPILMGVVFFLQQKFTPKPAAVSPEQEQQQKMMMWMTTLMFPLLLYTGPSGLNLYILTSTAIGIWESKRVRDHLKAREEAEKAGRVIVDAKPTRAGKRLSRDEHAAEPKRGGLGGWLANLQAKAEQMRREQDKGKKGKK